MQIAGYGFVTNNNPRPFGGIQPTNQPTRITTMTNEQPKPTEEVVVIIWTSGQMEVYRRNSEELLEIFISQHEYIDTVYEAQMKE